MVSTCNQCTGHSSPFKGREEGRNLVSTFSPTCNEVLSALTIFSFPCLHCTALNHLHYFWYQTTAGHKDGRIVVWMTQMPIVLPNNPIVRSWEHPFVYGTSVSCQYIIETRCFVGGCLGFLLMLSYFLKNLYFIELPIPIVSPGMDFLPVARPRPTLALPMEPILLVISHRS